MQSYTIWHRLAIILGTLSLLTITYISLLLNQFKTTEKTSDFFKNSNAYYYIAEIIKADIRNRYSQQLKNNVIQLTTADAVLNYVVTPNLVERIALPVLQVRQRIAQMPLSFAENNLVINTQQYTQQLSSTLTSLQLPPPITDAVNNLIASVPPQITVVDVSKNPNSIAVSITKTRVFFENLQKILTTSWIIFLLALITLLLVNMTLLKRLVWGLFLIAVIVGGIGVLASYVVPWIASSMSSNPDPVAGVLKDNLWDSMVWYYFTLTRSLSLIYLAIALGLYLLYRFVPFQSLQEWMNIHLLQEHTQTPKMTQGKKK